MKRTMNIAEIVGFVESTLSDKGIIIDRIIKDNLVEFVESHSKIDTRSDEVIHTYHENEGFHSSLCNSSIVTTTQLLH